MQRLLFTLIIYCHTITCQNQLSITGYVYIEGSKLTLPGVTVSCSRSQFSTITNQFGFYAINCVFQDTIRLHFSCPGYQDFEKLISLDDIDVSVSLIRKPNTLQEVNVTATKPEIESNSILSVLNLPIDKIKEIPALMGEKDPLKVLQLMPGIQSGREGAAGLYVRGGELGQNLILLDDATIYNSYHLFGFFSVFNNDILKSVTLTKGGFPSHLGGRVSSVIEVESKDGNKEKLHGNVNIGLISSRISIEGPIMKNRCSFIFSARRTYIDGISKPLLKKYDITGSYYFYDINCKIDYLLNSRNQISVSSFLGKDHFNNEISNPDSSRSLAVLDWGNFSAGLKWRHKFSPRFHTNTSIFVTDYNFSVKNKVTSQISVFDLLYTSAINDYSGKVVFDYNKNLSHHFKFGFQSTMHKFRPGTTVIKNTLATQAISKQTFYEFVENSLFAEDSWKITRKIQTSAGLRFSNIFQKDNVVINPEPRITIGFLLDSSTSLNASYSRMVQYMHLLSNTGLGLPTDLWVPATRKAPLMRSDQLAAGLTKTISSSIIELSLEGYYKKMNNVLAYKEGASFLNIRDNGEPSNWEDNITSGMGFSYGLELLCRKNKGKLTGWIGYTLSWTKLRFKDINFGKTFFAKYDRRHDLSLVAVYRLSEKVKLSSTFVYGSGSALTLPISKYTARGYSSPLILGNNQAPLLEVQDYGSQRNAFRASPYHRLDIGIQFQKRKKHYTRTIEFGIYNVYNRMNPYYYYLETQNNGEQKLMQISLFPIIPSLSCNWMF